MLRRHAINYPVNDRLFLGTTHFASIASPDAECILVQIPVLPHRDAFLAVPYLPQGAASFLARICRTNVRILDRTSIQQTERQEASKALFAELWGSFGRALTAPRARFINTKPQSPPAPGSGGLSATPHPAPGRGFSLGCVRFCPSISIDE